MKRVNVIVSLILIALFFGACSEREDEIASKSKKSAVIEKPSDGFLLNCKHADGSADIITGVDFRDFVRFRTIDKDNSVVEDFSVLYAYEDIGDITISDKKDDSFTLSAFGDKFQIYDVKDVKGGIEFKTTREGCEVLTAVLLLDSLNKAEWLKLLYSSSVVPNPFSNGSNEKIGPLTITLISAGAVVLAAVIDKATDVIIDACQNQRSIDKHNCERSSKKCLKANGRCHYTCVSCKK